MEIQEIYKKLGLDRNELYSSYSAIQKIMWEQVLLLCIYSRQLYFSKQGSQVHQRVKLINRIHFAGRDKLKPFILELIEHGCSSTEIITFLLKFISKEDVQDQPEENLDIVSKLYRACIKRISPQSEIDKNRLINNAKEILKDIEEKQIAFPSSKEDEHPYSYFSMYQSLRNSFEIFKKLLEIDTQIEKMDLIVLRSAKKYLKNGVIINSPTFISNFDELLKYILDNNRNCDSLNIYVKSDIIKVLSNFCRDIFSFITIYDYLDNHYNHEDKYDRFYDLDQSNLPTPLSEISAVHCIDNQLMVFFNKNTLKDLIHLGQIDSVMKGVKENILDALEGPSFIRVNDKNIRENNADALKKIELWHKKQEFKLIKKNDQVPKLIASIIEFDIRNQLGFCDRDIGYNVLTPILDYKRISMQEIYILVTNLIKRCLYEKSGLNSYISTYNGVSIEEFILKYFDNSDYRTSKEIPKDELEISFFSNTMMSTWANEDPSSIHERFKKLPSYLKGNKINFVIDIIGQQRKVKTTNIYPVDSSFPLPLWVKFLKTDF